MPKRLEVARQLLQPGEPPAVATTGGTPRSFERRKPPLKLLSARRCSPQRTGSATQAKPTSVGLKHLILRVFRAGGESSALGRVSLSIAQTHSRSAGDWRTRTRVRLVTGEGTLFV
ncbi:MAG: hypothetical protein KME30_22665 [Iphinoe sp. HA4291-MV1]|nr:hypothetical protein [Iphinoe sp. HA4291-MV1]